MQDFKDYQIYEFKKQDEIQIMGGQEELSKKELNEVAQKIGIGKYQVVFRKTHGSNNNSEGFEYLNYYLVYGPRSSKWIDSQTTYVSVLNSENIESIYKHFKTESEYRTLMQNLRKTRKGLMHIHDQSPHYKDEIMEQMKAINNLIGAFYVDDLPHPWHEESEGGSSIGYSPEISQ